MTEDRGILPKDVETEIPLQEYEDAIAFCMERGKNKVLVVVRELDVQEKVAESLARTRNADIRPIDTFNGTSTKDTVILTGYSPQRLDEGDYEGERDIQGNVRRFDNESTMDRQVSILVLANKKPNANFKNFKSVGGSISAPWSNGPFNEAHGIWELRPSSGGKLEVVELFNEEVQRDHMGWVEEKVDYKKI